MLTNVFHLYQLGLITTMEATEALPDSRIQLVS